MKRPQATLNTRLAFYLSAAAFLVPILSSVLFQVLISSQVSIVPESVSLDRPSTPFVHLDLPPLAEDASVSTKREPSTDEEPLVVMGRLVPRATITKIRHVNESLCYWNSTIEGTYTKPLWLVLGLSGGAIAGMIIFAYTSYLYGKSSGGAGGMGMGGGAAPPPAY